MFPIDKLAKIKKTPENFRLIEIVPYQLIQSFPHTISERFGDEILLSVIDTETTGINPEVDEVIEFGWVQLEYSPSADTVTAILECGTMYQEPSINIPSLITDITGITDEMVKGKTFDLDTIKRVLTQAKIVVAHNKSFDQAFIDASFSSLLSGNKIQWACSMKQIDWKDRGFPSKSLEMLLIKSGFFYTAHRADTDCLALSFLLSHSNNAMQELLTNVNKQMVLVKAFGSPFETKDALKEMKFSWNGEERVWQKETDDSKVDSLLSELDTLYRNASSSAKITSIATATVYK